MTAEQTPSESIELPVDIEAAEVLLRDLQAEVTDIQSQLGNRDRRHPDGSRYTSIEYWNWRGRASYALSRKYADLREIKAHVRKLRDAEYAATAPSYSHRRLVDSLVRCYRAGDAAGTAAAVAMIVETWEIRD